MCGNECIIISSFKRVSSIWTYSSSKLDSAVRSCAVDQGRSGTDRVEEEILSRVDLRLRVVVDLMDDERLSGHLQEAQIGSAASLEAEVADRIRAQQCLQRRHEQGKCRFKVNAIGGEDDVRLRRDSLRYWLSPVQHTGGYDRGETIELDVVLHQREHRLLIGNMDGRDSDIAASCDCKAHESPASSKFDTNRQSDSQRATS